jgi:hypothetical protein
MEMVVINGGTDKRERERERGFMDKDLRELAHELVAIQNLAKLISVGLKGRTAD